jgi:hypothetical protein
MGETIGESIKLALGQKVLVISNYGNVEGSGKITALSSNGEFARVSFGWPSWWWGWTWAETKRIRRIEEA